MLEIPETRTIAEQAERILIGKSIIAKRVNH